jgi:membrane fusion protein (multidrug efflux system)
MTKLFPANTWLPVLFLSALAMLAGCKPQVQAPKPPDVEVVTVEEKTVPVYTEVVGTVQANVNATISAQVTGYLLRQDYTEGQLVKKGDLLFEIDDRTYQATLDQQLAKLEKTKLDVQRYTPLAKMQAISQQELDDAIQANLAAQAEVDAAQLNVNFCKITAPVDGAAGLAQGQIGDLVGPGTGPLTTVTSIDPMRVYFAVSQQLMSTMIERVIARGQKLRTSTNGLELELLFASGYQYPFKGRVRFSNNQVDVKTGTVRVVGEFPNPQQMLVPGMFVSVRALLDTLTNALVVPQRAVADVQGRSLVAVVGADNKVSIRPVQLGVQFGPLWVVTGNVKPGDRIVAEGIQKVRDGGVVNPVPSGALKSGEDLTGGRKTE